MNFVIVMTGTLLSVVGMVELKNRINRSEAMRAMENLGQIVSDYKAKNGSIPPESHIEGIKKSLEGHVRLGSLQYRARWIEFDSPPDEILAYVRKSYHSLFSKPGAIVLRIDGSVQWMNKKDFDKLIALQQSPLEVEMHPQ